MDIKELSNSQLILLCVLISFVSSIATTVSVITLTQGSHTAPVNTTINRVIERTIEKATTTILHSEPEIKTVPVVSVGEISDFSSAVMEASEVLQEIQIVNGGEVVNIGTVFFKEDSLIIENSFVSEENKYQIVKDDDEIIVLELNNIDKNISMLSSDLLFNKSAANLIVEESEVELGLGVFSIYKKGTAIILAHGLISKLDFGNKKDIGISSLTLANIPLGSPIFSAKGDLIGVISITDSGEKHIHSLVIVSPKGVTGEDVVNDGNSPQ